jgi:toxin ParE1/3/4
LVDAIEATCELYARQPELGELRPDLGRALRVFRVGNYVVAYQPAEDGILVIRVVDGRRDYPALF